MGCLSIFNSNKIISNISANGALLYMVMYVRETARRSSAECFASLRSVQGQSPCAAWRLFLLCRRRKQGFEDPKTSNRMERGVVPALHFTCWYFIPNPENSKAPDLEVESFFGVAPMRALWFYATAVTAVTMFCTYPKPRNAKLRLIAYSPGSERRSGFAAGGLSAAPLLRCGGCGIIAAWRR